MEGGAVKDYYRGVKKQRELRDLLRSREYQVGEQYPSQRVQDQLAYLADRVVEAEHSIIPQAGRALKAAEDIGPG